MGLANLFTVHRTLMVQSSTIMSHLTSINASMMSRPCHLSCVSPQAFLLRPCLCKRGINISCQVSGGVLTTLKQPETHQSSSPTSGPSAPRVPWIWSSLTTCWLLSWLSHHLSPMLMWLPLHCSFCSCSCTHTLFIPQIPKLPKIRKLDLIIFCFPTVPHQLCPKSSLWLISPSREP